MCDKFQKAIDCGIIIKEEDYFIWGPPQVEDDGYDTNAGLTNQYPIEYCPWCGKKLSITGGKDEEANIFYDIPFHGIFKLECC